MKRSLQKIPVQFLLLGAKDNVGDITTRRAA